jgi:hypothetical protein
VPYEKTYNWNLPVSHINYPNHFQVSRSLILPSYHCDSVIVIIMCRNCAFCWNSSTFCWHNFFSVNIKRLYTEGGLSRPTKVCRKNTKWQPYSWRCVIAHLNFPPTVLYTEAYLDFVSAVVTSFYDVAVRNLHWTLEHYHTPGVHNSKSMTAEYFV